MTVTNCCQLESFVQSNGRYSICRHESFMKTLNLRKETVQTAALPTLGFNGDIASILICRFHGTVGTTILFWMAVLW